LPEPLAISARVTRYDPGHITVNLSAPAPEGSALVVSENYYPGWRAKVDGKPAVTGRADFTLIGVALPTGARNVDLTFESRPYEVGKAITLIAIAVSLLLVATGLFLEKRRRD
ncbi:MAG: YfhO family protein, partial [Gemmatimonadaceae bacterium]